MPFEELGAISAGRLREVRRFRPGERQELGDVRVIDHRDARVVLRNEMLEGGRRTVAVERTAPIRQHENHHSVGSQHPLDLVEEADRVGEVLEHVTANDEVLSPVLDHAEPVDVEVGDDVGREERHLGTELRIELVAVFGSPAIDVADLEVAR